MNNREAAKALLEGKTLRIINKSQKDITYKFDKEVLGIVTSAEDIYWNIKDFNDDCEWEEVKELYKKEVIVTCDENGYIKESVKIQNQTSIYNFANATTISLMMREANRGAHIDTKIIENSLKQDFYKKEVIVTCDENGYIKECERFYPDQDERANKKYKIIIEEIIK